MEHLVYPRLIILHALSHLSLISQPPCELSTTVIPILLVRQLDLRETNLPKLAQLVGENLVSL